MLLLFELKNWKIYTNQSMTGSDLMLSAQLVGDDVPVLNTIKTGLPRFQTD